MAKTDRRATRGLLLAIAAVLLVVGYIAVAHTPERTPEPQSVSEKASAEPAVVEASAPLDPATSAPEDSRRVASAVTADFGGGESVPAEISNPIAGRVRICAVDAQTGNWLASIRVRAVSDARLADRTTDVGDAEFLLTPDTYTFLVMSQGYEPSESAPVAVARGETVAPDPFRLRAGSARILGVVTGDLPPESGLSVELLGEGRGPCANCAGQAWMWEEAPCPTCGFATKSSSLRIPRSGVFAFERLAGGPYAIRLFDAQGRTVGIPKRFDVRAGESVPVEFEFVSSRVVRVEVVDTDGRSLAGEWAARARGKVETVSDDDVDPVVEGPSTPSTKSDCAFRLGGRCLAQTTFDPPAPLNPTTMVAVGAGRRPSPFGIRILRGGPGKDVDDRPRKNVEPLRPPSHWPSFDANTMDFTLDAEGLANFAPVPSLALTLEMKCGPFTGTTPVPASGTTTLLRVTLKRASAPEHEDGTFLDYEAGRLR